MVQENIAAAQKTVQAALDAGEAAVVRLDAIVTNKLRGDEEALAVSANARRVSRIHGGTGRQPATPAPAPPPAQTAGPTPVTKTAA
jgi:hypothetical protein